MKQLLLLLSVLFLQLLAGASAIAKEFNVSVNGNDKNDGSVQSPFKTITAAAQVAQPGDVITVHAGVYRERINPPRGGASDEQRIVYQAAPGEKVEIAGSEVIKNWVKAQGDAWKVTIPNRFFGGFNPYSDLLHGDWFHAAGEKGHPNASKQRHTGMVYLDGTWMIEAPKLEDVMKPAAAAPLWYSEADKENTTIWAQFKGVNPNEQQVEINVRQAVFYPEKAGMNYITVRGFTLRDAATPWASPSSEEIALIGPHWSKGWIIENNVITHSTCVGISLGKYGDQWDNTRGTYGGFLKTIPDVLRDGWDTVGHHIVRNNTISYCDQSGLNGGFGAVFSQITGNHIFQIANRGQLVGENMAAIKFLGSVDVLIKNNRIDNSLLAMWMDWMAQGVRISGNLCYSNGADLMMEVDHGPYLVDNNLFLSHFTLQDVSEGGAFVHNLIAGGISTMPDNRSTPYFKAHSTVIAGFSSIASGDDRFFNNIFVGTGRRADGLLQGNERPGHFTGFGLAEYDARKFSVLAAGNVYYNEARPYVEEKNPVVEAKYNPGVKVLEQGDHVSLQINLGNALANAKTTLVTTELLGKARVPNLPYENPDGSPLRVDKDFFSKARDGAHPSPGPFEKLGVGEQKVRVW